MLGMAPHRKLAILLLIAGFAIFFFAPNTSQHDVSVSDCLLGTHLWTTWGGAPEYLGVVGFSDIPLVGFLLMIVGVVLLVLPHVMPAAAKAV